jgi:hypothetical protein
MELGDAVIYSGRRFYLRGFDPAGVAPRYAYLEDAATGMGVQVPFREEWLEMQVGERILRLVDDDSEHQN